MAGNGYRIWHIGGEDVRLRIPLLLALRKKGFEVGAAGSEGGAAFENNGIEYHTYPLERGLNPVADLRSIHALKRLFQNHTVDVVHAFDTKPAYLVPLAARAGRIPIVIRTIPGMGYVFSSRSPYALALRPVYRYLQRQGGRLSDMTVFQNRDDASYYLDNNMVSKAKHRIILGSGVDLEAYDPDLVDANRLIDLRCELKINNRIVITMVARLVRHKGIEEYLEAARMVKSRCSEAYFLLVGPRGTEGRQAVSEELVQRYSDVVMYLGPRPDVRELLSITDVFVLPSYYREGVPRVLLEAGAMGLPLVTTDMPGCREIVKHDWNGLLVPPRNSVALAEAIECLIADREQRAIMGKRSQMHMRENFGLDKVADAHADLYRELLGRRRMGNGGHLCRTCLPFDGTAKRKDFLTTGRTEKTEVR